MNEKQIVAVGRNAQLTTAPNGKQQTAVNWQLLYDHLVIACCQYFDPDADNVQLTSAYNKIFGHMTNTADMVEVAE